MTGNYRTGVLPDQWHLLEKSPGCGYGGFRIPPTGRLTVTSTLNSGVALTYPNIETGRCDKPRIGPECIRTGAPVTVHSGERVRSSEYTIWASRRASGAPRQKWIPWPN